MGPAAELPVRWAAPTGINEVKIEIVPADVADRPVVENLLQLYLYDFSEALDTTVQSSGFFAYPDISAYWADPNRLPFLFKCRDLPAGFALVSRGSVWSDEPEVYDMAEFFVLRGRRRHGIGRAAAGALFERFPGSWDVRVLVGDAAALEFWSVVIRAFADGAIAKKEWTDPSGLKHLVHRFRTLRKGSA